MPVAEKSSMRRGYPARPIRSSGVGIKVNAALRFAIKSLGADAVAPRQFSRAKSPLRP